MLVVDVVDYFEDSKLITLGRTIGSNMQWIRQGEDKEGVDLKRKLFL